MNFYQESFLNCQKFQSLNNFNDEILVSAKKLTNQILNKEIAAIEIINEIQDLDKFQEIANYTKNFEKILILGVGGSSLGAKTISSLINQNRVQFLESIDPTTISNALENINYKKTCFLVISKSGETIETICQTLVVTKKIKQLQIKNFAQNFIFVTENKKSSLRNIAEELGSKIYEHPNNIGGRFSCFSIVGMLPAIILELDAKKIRNGAKKMINHFLNNSAISGSCKLQLNLYENGFGSNVIMPYIDDLKNYTDWYRQLCSESLGKSNFGPTPINSMGTIDQHSQLQLYLEGPKNKFFTFITAKNSINDFKIEDLENSPTLFGSKNLSEIVRIEKETTIEVLNQKKLPIRIIEIEELNEESLGALMMQTFLEIIIIAYAKNIDPFDQPGVEIRKKLARKILQND
jgi:glucose-6-phosphate isomerase